MDLRQLEYFVQVAALGGFNRASGHLNIAQSALSRRIAQLEAELGVSLLIRSVRGVQLTSAGELLLRRADTLLRHFRQVRDEVVAEATVPKGELIVGMPPSLQSMLVVPFLREMRERCPEVVLTTWVSTSIGLKELILGGKIDISVLGIMESDTSLEFEPLLLDDMFLIGPSEAGLKARLSSWSQIATLPLILTSAPNSVRLLVDAAAAKAGERLNVVMEANYVPVLIDLIRAGAGYTLLPYSAVHELLARGEVTAAKINGLAYTWVIATQKQKPLSTAGRFARDILVRLTAHRVTVEKWPHARLPRASKAAATGSAGRDISAPRAP